MRVPLPVVACLFLALVALATPAAAAIGPGPRLAFVEWLAEPPMTRLTTLAADGSGRSTLPLGGVQPLPFEGPAWSADGSTLVFGGYPVDAKGEIRGGAKLFAVEAEGGAPRGLPGTRGASHPVLSPDGARIAFERSKLDFRFDRNDPAAFGYYSSATTWVVSSAGGRPRQLTPWRRGLAISPAAFSPDGSTLLLERDRKRGWAPEVLARDLGGGPLRLIDRHAEDPAFSPDGTEIALVSYRDRVTRLGRNGPEVMSELYVVRADGSEPRRLTRSWTKQESQPSWSPDGQRLAFLRTPGPGGSGFGSALVQANADGSCARRVAGSSGRLEPALYGPVWQPGPGREAMVLEC